MLKRTILSLQSICALTCLCLVLGSSVAIAATPAIQPPNPRKNYPVDLAPFGTPLVGKDFVGVEWDNRIRIQTVAIDGVDAETARKLHVEWWGSVWPANGTGGWMRLDDPHNVEWVRVPDIEWKRRPIDPETGKRAGGYYSQLPTLTKEEWRKALEPERYEEYLDNKPPTFRNTLKFRIKTDESELPEGLTFSVYGKGIWRQETFRIEMKLPADGSRQAGIGVKYGVLSRLTSLPAPFDVSLDGTSWQGSGHGGQAKGVAADVWYIHFREDDFVSNETTRVTVRFGDDRSATGFSFVPQDVFETEDRAMRVPDFQALVCDSDAGLTMVNDPGPPPGHWRNPVRLRVQNQPEMTREMAMQGIPRLYPERWAPLGVPSARQEFFVSRRGDFSMWGMSLGNRWPEVFAAGQDSERIPFRSRDLENHLADKFFVLLDSRAEPTFDGTDRENLKRYLEDDHLPLMHVEWYHNGIHYHHQLLAAILQGDYGDDDTRRGDETVVLLTRLDVNNPTREAKQAHLNVRWSDPTPMSLRDNGVIDINPDDTSEVPEGLIPTRGQVLTGDPVGGKPAGWTFKPGNDPEASQILSWSDKLAGEETKTFYFKAPFVDLLEADELTALTTINYEKQSDLVLDYWRQRLEEGMRLETPDEAVNNFYKANLWHNIITTDRDPKTGLYNQGVGTVRYGVFANETVMIARSMDMRGEHKEAERFIEPMLHFQGDLELKGLWSTKEGAFHSAGPYTHGEYAMNHGFVLWGIADHYFYTRDQEYLERVAPQVVKGCDFLIQERSVTMTGRGSERPPFYGLMPPSSLEDVVEYQYWFAPNAYFYLGMKRAAEALAEIDHPDAKRIAAEAEHYRKDIEAAIREATTMTAAVQRRDGYFIPYTPSRVYHWRHLTEGWIREALYPAIHLATAEVLSPDDPIITWMLDSLEDNIYFSEQSGYGIENVDENWFSLGAVTKQPCLVDTPIIYMQRNEMKASMRSLWNTYALSIYPDIQAFAEWAKQIGMGGGPLYKTSDECRFLMWVRELLIYEDGDTLWYGRGMPAEWCEEGKSVWIEDAVTKFGVTELRTISDIEIGRISMMVKIPERNPPERVMVRSRHPLGYLPTRVEINGREWRGLNFEGTDLELPLSKLPTDRPIRIMFAYKAL